MEQKLDELLHNLHRYQFADAEQIVTELRHFILDRAHKDAELAFISSKIFNSPDSLLQFLRQNSQMNERILSTVKKRIYELIIEYIKHRKQEVSGYLEQIKGTCMVSFLSDPNSLVREVSLLVLYKLIESYKETEDIIKPADLVIKLLDEIKLRNPAATVKGAIWQLVGLLHANYNKQVGMHIVESQDVQFQMLMEQVKTNKPEIKAIIGMLKGFVHSFQIECTLDEPQRNGLFLILKTLMAPIQDVQNKGVIKAAMKLLSQHANLFTDQIMKQAMDLLGRTLQLCTQDNIEVRDAANDLLGSLIKLISDNLDRNKDSDIKLFKMIMVQFDQILESNDFKNIQLLSAIRAVGIFSKAIQTILGDEKLWTYLQKLTELSEQKLIKEFMDQDKPESDLHNFKYILKKQKQLIAYIESYSFIIRNLNQEPSEKFRLHFMKVGSIGVNNHRKLYSKYRTRFYEAIAQLTMSLSNFENGFKSWIKMFVRDSLTETLKIPDSVIYGGESPAESLEDAVTFWKEYIGKDQIWTEIHCRKVYDQLIETCLKDIIDLDLSYKVERSEKANNETTEGEANDQDMQHSYSNVEYIANNPNDQQYMIRLTNFLTLFLPASQDKWLLKFVPKICQILVKKATGAPRIPKIYVLMQVVLEICSKYKYFELKADANEMQIDQRNAEEQQIEDLAQSDKKNTYNMLLTFLKDLIGKSEEFQDELLESSVTLLLKVPIVIIHQNVSNTDNLYLWKGVMIKALGLSQLNNKLALSCINTLESWFNALPVSLVAELYSDVLPKLSNFLQVDVQSDGHQDTYFFQDLIKDTKDVKIDRREIANKVIDLLGKIGGHAHKIINNELTKNHDKENFIRWDSEKRLKLTIPLNQRKIDIYLDSCLPRIIDIAKSSNEKQTRIAACELLHGLVLYMIGKSATKPKELRKANRTAIEQEKVSKAAFAKLYAKLFPVIIKLATEIEVVSRQLFEPLIFQIVRWFSSSKVDEHAEVESLLDALIEGSQSRNNSALREICCNAVAVFAQWTLKQSNDQEIANIPVNIRSLIRRIESNSNHPDPFRRLSSVLCFGKILMVIKDFDPLVDRFCLEIARNVLSSLKQCHNSLEFSQDVIENCSALLKQIQDLIIKKMDLLKRENSKRSVHTSLNQFLDFLFARFTAVETVYRRESVKLWEGLITPLGKNAIQKTILTKYVPQPGEKTFWKLTPIKFDQKGPKLGAEFKRQKYLEQQTQLDTLTAQLEFLNWMINTAKFKYSELSSKLQIELKAVKQSIESYLIHRVKPCFDKSVRQNSVQSLLACKEDREQLTKSSMKLLTQFYQLISILDDCEILDLVKISNSCSGGSDHYLFDLAVQIVLVPAAHRLNLLVQDYELESQLRRQCDVFILRTLKQNEKDKMDTDQANSGDFFVISRIESLRALLPIIDLEKLMIKNKQMQDELPSLVHPRILTGLLIGYLKIGNQSQEMRNALLDVSERLGPTIEQWIESDLPIYIESSRLLVSFMAQLRIPNETLFNWLTSKSFVFQKTSDLLLSFISDNWMKEKVHLGEYLIQKAAKELTLLAVFLPIIQVVGKNKKGFQEVLIKQIPQNWGTAEFETEYAEKQVQIYFMIVSNFSDSFEKQQTKESVTFVSFVIQQAKNFLSSVKHNIYFKRQVLRLVGKLYNLNLGQEHISIHTRMKASLESFLTNNLPIVSRDLTSNKNEIMNYEQLIQGYLDLLDLSKSPQVFQLLYRVIREHKPMYLAERIRSCLNNFVVTVINNPDLNFHSFYLLFDQYLTQFFDQSSIAPDDNLRWAIANKIINRVLETCNRERLEELFQTIFTTRLQPSLNKNLLLLQQYDLYNAVREKTHVMLMLEIFIRRLDQSKEKRDLRNNMYCPGGRGNELNTYIIETSRSALIEDFSQFEQRCSDVKDKIQLQEINSISHISRRYACAGYTLLSSTIVSTQVKQNAYQNFLFSNWEHIIDVNNEQLYQFDILTNFNTISLHSIEQKVVESQNFAEVREKILVQEYVTQSFMQTNEKFNSAMVFETQLDPQVAKNKQFTLEGKKSDIETSTDNPQANNFEIDKVNKHECMKNIKRVLDKMQELFSKEWTKDNLPMFMQALLLQVNNTKFLNVKVFILKLLVNNPEIFEPYAQFWIEPICNYITGKQKNGKGFHYFHRDLATLLITWSKSYTVTQEQSALFSKVINTIIRLAADKQKVIFNINIEMLAVLMSNWRAVVVLEKDQLVKMLQVLDSTEGSHLWKMTAIQVIALACSFNLPIRNVADQSVYTSHECKFLDPSSTKMDPLLEALLKCQGMNKKQLIFASSEALGKVLVIQPALAAFVLPFIMQNDVKEKHDVIVNVIERVTREFPMLLAQRRIFLKLLSFINNLTGSMRSAILKSLTRYYVVCAPGDKKDITDTVKAICEDVLSDRSEENQQSFLVFVFQVTRIDKQAGTEILRRIADRLKPVYISNKNEQIRDIFYDLMIHLYDTNEEFKGVAKSSLIRGLSDQSPIIQEKLLRYWNQPSRLSNDPYQRMEQLLTVLYDQEEEPIWLNNATLLLMQVSELSDDFNRKIFEESLKDCKFQPLIINQYKINPNRSQPVTNTIQQYVAYTQTQQEFHQQRLKKLTTNKTQLKSIPEEPLGSNEDHEMRDEQQIDTTNQQMTESQDGHFKVAGQQSLSSESQNNSQPQYLGGAFIRSTQDPFQPTSQLKFQNYSSVYGSNSSLAASSEIPQSQAFYKNLNTRQIVRKAMKAQDNFEDPTNSIIEAGRYQATRKDQDLALMMSANNIKYSKVKDEQGKIRIEEDGQSKPSQLAREEEKKMLQQKQLETSLKNLKKNHVTLIRTYRVGEIPDIEIDYKDLLKPLMALVKRDSTIATEIMLELFTQIYKGSPVESRKNLGAGIKGILQQSIKFDYGIINTTHRIAIELLKIDGFDLDPEVVERTGRSSMSFQTSLLLLEESILQSKDLHPPIPQKSEKSIKEQIVNGFGQITSNTKSAWFSLIQLYELVGNEDALKGIWCSIGNRKEVMIKQGVQVPSQVDEAVDLIKQAQIKRSQGNIRQGLKMLEDILASPTFQSTFEEQVQLELMNKKYESFSELSKWENISALSLQQHAGKQLYDIPFFQAETMIRAQLRCGNQWGNLLQQVQHWHSDPTSKIYLEKRFNYEQAMLQITSGDFDRARFYINKDSNDLLSQWKDLTKLSQVAQHFLVQKIQKIYEMKEFLSITKQLSLKNFDELAPEALLQIQNWIQRQPNYSFDKLNVWDDILTARMLFLDQYKLNFKKDSSFNDQLSGRVPSRFKDLQNIGAILYTQSAKGAFRMGLLDSSNTYLLKALEQRSEGNQKNNLGVVVPIIKLNIEQVKQQHLNENWGFEKKYEKFSNVLLTLQTKIGKDVSNDVAIQIKATMLKQSLHKKLLSMLISDVNTSSQERDFVKLRQNQINDQITEAFSTHQRVEDLLQLGQFGTKDQVKAKSLFHFSKLCDKLLRDSEDIDKAAEKDLDSKQKILEKAFNKVGFKRDGIAKLCIRNAFSAINLGYLKARDIIPRLLDIISKHNHPDIDQEFVRSSKETPAWVFIRWISQLVAFLNTQKSEVIDDKISQIYKKYPQSIFYPFNVLESNLRINILDENEDQTPLFKKTKLFFEKNHKNLYRWTEALEGLVHPEQRFHSWARLIEDAALRCKQTNNRSRMDKLVRLMIEDVALVDKRFVGREIGDYNKKFADLHSKHLTSLEAKRMIPDRLLDELDKIKKHVLVSNLSTGELSLSEFSEYLVNLDNNDFYNSEVFIEVPGQYDNQDQEPIQNKNVKIASIKKSVLILTSQMRPKRITVHGSNEKDFNLLIKGGEDLRLDQRIQQIFHIVNGIFKEDSACQSRNLNLKTFGIVPITNSMGSLEWIDSTEPLKVMINREHQRVERGTDLKDCAALTATYRWLTKIAGNRSDISPAQKHKYLMSLDRDSVVDAFTRHQQMMKWSLLRNGLENLCLTSSAFITIKDMFVKSMAVFSIVSYLLGIGDRHLENFLVNTTDGEVLGIDFGYSFGAGVQLAVPELIPFRLTQQIEGVIAPHTNDGVYKQTMIHVLNALRKKKNIILDTCDIFVKEPLLDWLKKAQEKKQGFDQSTDGEKQLEQLSFYPKKKIATLKDKLQGRHPVQIIIRELGESHHANANCRVYYDQLVLALKGPVGSIRSEQLQKPNWQRRYSTVEEQVDCLIEMARDPNILGRAWIGWGAYL